MEELAVEAINNSNRSANDSETTEVSTNSLLLFGNFPRISNDSIQILSGKFRKSMADIALLNKVLVANINMQVIR